jgi:hypothetical protein
MGVGISACAITVGAVLYFAVTATVGGISMATIGVLLMVSGGVGLLAAVIALGAARRSAMFRSIECAYTWRHP